MKNTYNNAGCITMIDLKTLLPCTLSLSVPARLRFYCCAETKIQHQFNHNLVLGFV